MLCTLPLAVSCSFWDVLGFVVVVASRLTAKAAALGQVAFLVPSWLAANVLKLGKPVGACPQQNCSITHVTLEFVLPPSIHPVCYLRWAGVCAVKTSLQACPKLTPHF